MKKFIIDKIMGICIGRPSPAGKLLKEMEQARKIRDEAQSLARTLAIVAVFESWSNRAEKAYKEGGQRIAVTLEEVETVAPLIKAYGGGRSWGQPKNGVLYTWEGMLLEVSS